MSTKKDNSYKMKVLSTLRSNLTTLMENRGWGNKELSEASGVAMSDLTKYRNPNYNTIPRVTELVKMCSVFHVTLDYMVGLDPSGRFAKIPDEDLKLINLYHKASDRDKIVIDTILEHYNLDSDSQ